VSQERQHRRMLHPLRPELWNIGDSENSRQIRIRLRVTVSLSEWTSKTSLGLLDLPVSIAWVSNEVKNKNRTFAADQGVPRVEALASLGPAAGIGRWQSVAAAFWACRLMAWLTPHTLLATLRSHAFDGQKARLLHPSGELSFAELASSWMSR
jgi:hypothetical protein